MGQLILTLPKGNRDFSLITAWLNKNGLKKGNSWLKPSGGNTLTIKVRPRDFALFTEEWTKAFPEKEDDEEVLPPNSSIVDEKASSKDKSADADQKEEENLFADNFFMALDLLKNNGGVKALSKEILQNYFNALFMREVEISVEEVSGGRFKVVLMWEINPEDLSLLKVAVESPKDAGFDQLGWYKEKGKAPIRPTLWFRLPQADVSSDAVVEVPAAKRRRGSLDPAVETRFSKARKFVLDNQQLLAENPEQFFLTYINILTGVGFDRLSFNVYDDKEGGEYVGVSIRKDTKDRDVIAEILSLAQKRSELSGFDELNFYNVTPKTRLAFDIWFEKPVPSPFSPDMAAWLSNGLATKVGEGVLALIRELGLDGSLLGQLEAILSSEMTPATVTFAQKLLSLLAKTGKLTEWLQAAGHVAKKPILVKEGTAYLEKEALVVSE